MRAATLPTILLSASLAAQTFTAADAVPPNGTFEFSRYYAEASAWSNVDTIGPGLIWNMTGLDWETDAPFTLTVMDATSSAFGSLAPEATTCMLEQSAGEFDLHRFYRNASDMLEAIGLVADAPGIPPELEDICPRLLLNYPATLGSVIDPGTAGCGSFIGLESVERKVLATGTLVLPFGSIPNMVLMRTSFCAVDVINPKGGNDITCTPQYEWYAPGNLLRPLLTVYTYFGEWNSAYLEVPTALLSVNEHASAITIALSPNPAVEQLQITNVNGLSLGEVSVHAADGRVVFSEAKTQRDRLQLDVQHLAPGLYTVRSMADGRVQALRFVKE